MRVRYQRGPSVSGREPGDSYDGATWGGAGSYEFTAATWYGSEFPLAGHTSPAPGVGGRYVSDAAVVVAAGVVAATIVAVERWGVVPAVPLLVASVLGVGGVLGRRVRPDRPRPRASIGRAGLLVVLLVVLVVVAGWRCDVAWQQLQPDVVGPYTGWVRVVDDPQPYASATRIVVEVDGERFEIWSRGRAQQRRVRTWRAGQWVMAAGERAEIEPDRVGRVAWQHVVGSFTLDWAADVDPGGPMARASNRVRQAVERAADVLPADDGALFRGLVVGDDRDQPPEMLERFRASGLSHLTAVSGQNVAFVLAAAGPLLRRVRRWPRLVVSIALIGWFVVLTRVEPSILRAGTMAILSAVGYATGRERTPLRLLALALTALLLVDPLLAWSIGFWLSVGATAGVTTVGPAIARRCARLGPVAVPLGVTLGAQIGVAAPSVLVFGRLPLVSVVANLLAVPVAGAVMLYGLPAGLVAGWSPSTAGVLMFPARLGTRWVDTVAALGARLEPPAPWPWVGWSAMAAISLVGVGVSVRRGKNRDLHGHASPHR